MNNQARLDRVQGCLMGVAIGDAIGMPVETMSHEQILAATNGVGVTGFLEPMSGRKWVVDLKAGSTTDDWQLTRAVAISLIRTKGMFDITDCAREHVRALENSVFGWGKTTQVAIEAIQRGERIPDRDPLPRANPGQGCGNGVVMKIAPVAIDHMLLADSRRISAVLWNVVKELGLITHPDIRASISAYAVAVFIHAAVSLEFIIGQRDFRELLLDVIAEVREIETREGITTELVSDKLSLIWSNTASAQDLREAVGSGFHAMETAAFTIGTFLRHPKDFRSGVLEAVNAGGDTDTNASIVGALIGANMGLQAIPEEWINFNPAFQEALDLGRQFCSE